MWFKRKPRNRRLERESVLDVKLRSSQVRTRRLRLGAVGLGLVFGLVGGAYVLWRGGEMLMDRLFYENKQFAIEDIDVQTDGIIAVDQLRRWAGVHPGQNLLALDLAKVRHDLEMASLIKFVAVERVPPRTLRIRVIEREPLAQIDLLVPRAAGGVETRCFQVDPDGYVMLPLEARQRATPPPPTPEQLPVLSGLNGNDVQAGRRIESPQAQAALQLLAAFERSPMESLVEIKRVDVSGPEVLVVTTTQGSEVTFGLRDMEQQLRRWHTIYETAQQYGKAIATLDLAVNNNIPARWLEASTVPATIHQLPKTPRSRKKHV